MKLTTRKRLNWRIPKGSGKRQSFKREAWPVAVFRDCPELMAARLECVTPYHTRRVKHGDHEPITAYLADYDGVKPGSPPVWSQIPGVHQTLSAARTAVQDWIDNCPGSWPRELRDLGVTDTNDEGSKNE